MFLKGRYFVMRDPILMNVGNERETSEDFLKSAVLQLFTRYSQSYVNLNVQSSPRLNSP